MSEQQVLSPEVELGIDILRSAKGVRNSVVQWVLGTKHLIGQNQLTPETLVDIAYLAFEINKAADEAKKESAMLRELAEKVSCAVWTTQHGADPEDKGYVEGAIARGTPSPGINPPSLDRKSPEYTSLMKSLGASEQVVGADVLRPHWPHLVDHINSLVEQGRPLPPGIRPDMTRPRWLLKSLKLRKGVTID